MTCLSSCTHDHKVVKQIILQISVISVLNDCLYLRKLVNVFSLQSHFMQKILALPGDHG